MLTRSVCIACLISILAIPRAALSDDFIVVVQRVSTADNLVTDTVTVNGTNIGPAFENDSVKIPAGTYPGALRTTSMKNFAQGPGGVLSTSGDFLLEIANVPGRPNILFHAGNQADQSDGCVMCGPATTDPATGAKLAPPTLRQLRLMFFDGNDNPTSTPDKTIKISVLDPS